MNDRRSIFRRENNTPTALGKGEGEKGRRGGPRDTQRNLTDRLLRPTPQFPSADMSIILPRKVVLWPSHGE